MLQKTISILSVLFLIIAFTQPVTAFDLSDLSLSPPVCEPETPPSLKGKDVCDTARKLQDKLKSARQASEDATRDLEKIKADKNAAEKELQTIREKIKSAEDKEYVDIIALAKEEKSALLKQCKQYRDLSNQLFIAAGLGFFDRISKFMSEHKKHTDSKLEDAKQGRRDKINNNANEIEKLSADVIKTQNEFKETQKNYLEINQTINNWQVTHGKHDPNSSCAQKIQDSLDNMKRQREIYYHGTVLQQDYLKKSTERIQILRTQNEKSQHVINSIDTYFQNRETNRMYDKTSAAYQQLVNIKDLISRDKDDMYATKQVQEWFLGGDIDILTSGNWEMILGEHEPAFKAERLKFLAEQCEVMAFGIDEGIKGYIQDMRKQTQLMDLRTLYDQEEKAIQNLKSFDPKISAAQAVAFRKNNYMNYIATIFQQAEEECKRLRDISELDKEESKYLYSCVCSCSLGAAGGTYAGYHPEPDGSPPDTNCGDLNNGPCLASQFGCWRAHPVYSGKCFEQCAVSRRVDPIAFSLRIEQERDSLSKNLLGQSKYLYNEFWSPLSGSETFSQRIRRKVKNNDIDKALKLADQASAAMLKYAGEIANFKKDISGRIPPLAGHMVSELDFPTAYTILDKAVTIDKNNVDAKGKLAQVRQWEQSWNQIKTDIPTAQALLESKKVCECQKLYEERILPLSKSFTIPIPFVNPGSSIRPGNEYVPIPGKDKLMNDLYNNLQISIGKCGAEFGPEIKSLKDYIIHREHAQYGVVVISHKQAFDSGNKLLSKNLCDCQRKEVEQIVKAAGESLKIETAQNLRKEGEILQKQNRLDEAIGKYTESLSYLPDPKLEDHIRLIKAQLDKTKNRKEKADRLWNEGIGLYNQNRHTDALGKLKDSLTYWSDQTRLDYVQKMEAAKASAKKLRDEGEAFQNQGKLQDAVNKYKQSVKTWPNPALEEHIAKVKDEIRRTDEKKACAKKNRDEGAALQQQNRLSEALDKFKASYACWPTPEMDKHIRDIQDYLAGQKTQATGHTTDTGQVSSQTPAGGTDTGLPAPSGFKLGRIWRVKQWIGKESWTWVWTRQGDSNTFDAVARHDQNGFESRHAIYFKSFENGKVTLSRPDAYGNYLGTLSPDGKQVVSGIMDSISDKNQGWTAVIEDQSAVLYGDVPGKWEYHADAYYFTDVHEFLPDGRMANDPKASWVLENNQLKVKWPNGWVNVYNWDPQASTLKGTAINSVGDRVEIRLVRMKPLTK